MSTEQVTKIDYLKEDTPIPGQNYVCLSFVSPEGIRNTSVRALKIRGVFDKYEEAQEFTQKLQKEDPNFNIFIGEVGKWLPWDPSPDDKTKVKNNEYYEEELQKLIKGYGDSLEKTKVYETERKKKMIENSVKQAKKVKSDSTINKELSKEELEKKKKEITEKENLIEKNKEDISEIDINIARLRDISNRKKKNKNN